MLATGFLYLKGCHAQPGDWISLRCQWSTSISPICARFNQPPVGGAATSAHTADRLEINAPFIISNPVLIAGRDDGRAGWFDGTGHAHREDGVHFPLPWTPSLFFACR